MLYKEYIKISQLALHKVGNKLKNDGVFTTKNAIKIDELLEINLLTYFLSSFKTDEYYNFFHESDLKYNEVYNYVKEIFTQPTALVTHSVALAKHLYEKSIHPKIKEGEFYVAYFKNCIINGETVDAVGLFKSENKDTFLNVLSNDDTFTIESQKGININKLDKGAIIFNINSEIGYMVSIVDNINKSAEARYWVEDFLHVLKCKDEYYNTQNLMMLTKNFVTKELPKTFNLSKVDQVELLNKTSKFFKEKDIFNIDGFVNEVMVQPEIIASFNQYKNTYAVKQHIKFLDDFSISISAFKKQARSFKGVIQLDNNFHIYIHGDRHLIEQGEDSKGKFYKFYYEEEQ